MPQKICGLGFDCASMMLQPGIDPGECLNYSKCGAAKKLTPSEEFELIRIRTEQIEARSLEIRRIEETIRMTRAAAATEMLMHRACPQSLQSLGVTSGLCGLDNLKSTLVQAIETIAAEYIAPESVEIHAYYVKRPWGKYKYNKLTAADKIFAPSEKREPVRVIHLSHSDDARYLEAYKGIERRNRIVKARRLIQNATSLLQEAINIITAPIEIESDVSVPVDATTAIEDEITITTTTTQAEVEESLSWEQKALLFLQEVNWQ